MRRFRPWHRPGPDTHPISDLLANAHANGATDIGIARREAEIHGDAPAETGAVAPAGPGPTLTVSSLPTQPPARTPAPTPAPTPFSGTVSCRRSRP